MNKLYILGALALAGADAYVAFTPTPGQALNVLVGLTTFIFDAQVAGSYTYLYTGDCLSSGSLATLGMNNNYYQYYSAALTGGTRTVTAIGQVITYTSATPTTLTTQTVAAAYSGCWHAHIYNWIAMPSMSGSGAVTSVTNGFGSAVSGYGYSMVGTATTDCTVSAIVTTDIFVTTGTLFKGGMFQSSAMTVTSTDAITPTLVTIPVWGTHGPGYLATTTGTAVIASALGVGISLATSQNSYWDFMQSSTIQGLTTLGRGGGTLGTGPCGWYVGYFYEAPSRGVVFAADAFNVADAAGAVTLNFWTDNSVLKAASAFVVAGLAGLLF